MTDDFISTDRAESNYIATGHPRRVQHVTFSLGVSVRDLERALGTHRLMLVRCSNLTAERLLGAK